MKNTRMHFFLTEIKENIPINIIQNIKAMKKENKINQLYGKRHHKQSKKKEKP